MSFLHGLKRYALEEVHGEQILFQWLDPASPWENGIISGAAMQVVGDYGFRHAKLCAGQSAGM